MQLGHADAGRYGYVQPGARTMLTMPRSFSSPLSLRRPHGRFSHPSLTRRLMCRSTMTTTTLMYKFVTMVTCLAWSTSVRSARTSRTEQMSLLTQQRQLI
jgi:hypothetical protein